MFVIYGIIKISHQYYDYIHSCLCKKNRLFKPEKYIILNKKQKYNKKHFILSNFICFDSVTEKYRLCHFKGVAWEIKNKK